MLGQLSQICWLKAEAYEELAVAGMLHLFTIDQQRAKWRAGSRRWQQRSRRCAGAAAVAGAAAALLAPTPIIAHIIDTHHVISDSSHFAAFPTISDNTKGKGHARQGLQGRLGKGCVG
jgi:hypothetical protein